MEQGLLILLVFAAGGLLGGVLAWLITKSRATAGYLSREEIGRLYIPRDAFDTLQAQADLSRDDLKEKEEELRELGKRLAAQEQIIFHLEEKMERQMQDFSALEQRSRLEFEQVANRLLEEKGRQFAESHHDQLSHLLNPLREKIKEFEEGIERRFRHETEDRISLKKEIEHLRSLNQQISQDAQNLVSALKGDSKTQGDWGEMRLELLLEKAGLNKGIHFSVQTTFENEQGRKQRPDFIIHLPEGKHLIIDSKVSLTAYEQFFQAADPADQQQFLQQHVDSIRRHIRDLSQKNYQQLYQIQSPDYLLLFVPIEPAFSVAVQQDHQLFLDALDRNIVLVTTSTLLATMRTVAFIWKQEKQKQSVQEIARQSGLLYDKFCLFIEDLRSIGQRIDQARGAYDDALRKLSEGKRYGDTLIGRAEKIRELGASASRQLPPELLPDEDVDELQ